MSTTLEILNLFRDLLKGEEHSHPFWWRLLAAFWGSWVFHGALVVSKLGRWNLKNAVDTAGMYEAAFIAIGFLGLATIIIYSLAFGLTVVASIPKSSLIRHFVYGVLLPAFAYSMPRIALGDEIIKSVNQ